MVNMNLYSQQPLNLALHRDWKQRRTVGGMNTNTSDQRPKTQTAEGWNQMLEDAYTQGEKIY